MYTRAPRIRTCMSYCTSSRGKVDEHFWCQFVQMDIGKLDKYHFCPKFQEMLFHADSNDYEKLRSLDKKMNISNLIWTIDSNLFALWELKN